MNIIFFGAQPYDINTFTQANTEFGFKIRFVPEKLSINTVNTIQDEIVLCAFVNDVLDNEVIHALSKTSIKLIALRCAGFNNVDLNAAQQFGIQVVRVPAYSPYSVAEHTFGLILALNRRTPRAFNRVRDGNFSLNGLLGFDLNGKTLGIIGVGKIGSVVAKIAKGFGMNVLAYDIQTDRESVDGDISYVEQDHLFSHSDIISIHCPLTEKTQHLINEKTLSLMKPNVMLINTSRGAVLDTEAVIRCLKSKKIGYLGLDVYEQESELFFQDLSSEIIQDDIFERLLTFPNVLITAHQGFFTEDALNNIARTTLSNIDEFKKKIPLTNVVS